LLQSRRRALCFNIASYIFGHTRVDPGYQRVDHIKKVASLDACLFFSEHQVYFTCRTTSVSETVREGPNVSPLAAALNTARLGEQLFSKVTKILSVSTDAVDDRLSFTQRNLSRQTDALDTFRGILTRSSFLTFWGISFQPHSGWKDPNVGTGLSLSWTPYSDFRSYGSSAAPAEHRHARRAKYPTWCWTSVQGEIHHDETAGGLLRYGPKIEGLDDDSSVAAPVVRFSLAAGYWQVKSFQDVVQCHRIKCYS